MISCATRASLKTLSGFEARHNSLVASVFENECVAHSAGRNAIPDGWDSLVFCSNLLAASTSDLANKFWAGTRSSIVAINRKVDRTNLKTSLQKAISRFFLTRFHLPSGKWSWRGLKSLALELSMCSISKLHILTHFRQELMLSATVFLHAPTLSWLGWKLGPGPMACSQPIEHIVKAMGTHVSLVLLAVSWARFIKALSALWTLLDCILWLKPILSYWFLFLHRDSVWLIQVLRVLLGVWSLYKHIMLLGIPTLLKLVQQLLIQNLHTLLWLHVMSSHIFWCSWLDIVWSNVAVSCLLEK